MSTLHPRKTISSQRKVPKTSSAKQWCRRNSSYNVGSLLSYSSPPEDSSDDDQEPRRLTIFSKSNAPVHQSAKHYCKSCYCNCPPITPLFNAFTDDHCGCRRIPSAAAPPIHGESVFLKYSPICKKRALQYTKARANYNNYTSNYFLDLKQQLAKLEEELKKETKDQACQVEEANLQEVREFRRKNFFECHGVQTQTDEDHQCVHEFQLDDNLVPKPLNCDVFGTSRCCVCQKGIPVDDGRKGSSSTLITTGVMSRPYSSVSSMRTRSAQINNFGSRDYMVKVPPLDATKFSSDYFAPFSRDSIQYHTDNLKKKSVQRMSATKETAHQKKRSLGGSVRMNIGGSKVLIAVPAKVLDKKEARKKGSRTYTAVPSDSFALNFQKGVY